jgi:orotate phosphoribosyltransferase
MTISTISPLQTEFLQAAISCQALRFGQFTLKSGRLSPYFFNAGMFCDGASITALTSAYADTLMQSGVGFDTLFGPAYKGIVLSAGLASQLSQRFARNVGFCYNRKEVKDHGEGGLLVGAALKGRVVIVDDVISAGTSVRESVQIIRASGAVPAAVMIALDRQERGQHSARSAAMEVSEEFDIPVLPVVNLHALLHFVAASAELAEHQPAIERYRAEYGA